MQQQPSAPPLFSQYYPSSSPPDPTSQPPTLLPAPALLLTPRIRLKRNANGLDPIDESDPDDAGTLEWGTTDGHRRTTSGDRGTAGLGLGLGVDMLGGEEGYAARRGHKRLRTLDVEPAFANLSLAHGRAPPPPPSVWPPAPGISFPPGQSSASTPTHFPPALLPIPSTGLAPSPTVSYRPNDTSSLPVTPPMQSGESSSYIPPVPHIRTLRPTPTPSPPASPYAGGGAGGAEDSKMASSYEISPNVVYVTTLDDSDDDDDDGGAKADADGAMRALEVHPAFFARRNSGGPAPFQSPLPPELVAPLRGLGGGGGEERGLVLYRPLRFADDGPGEREKRKEEFREYTRARAEEEKKLDHPEETVGMGMGEEEVGNPGDEDVDMMDVE